MNELAALALIIGRQELALQQRDQTIATLRRELEECRAATVERETDANTR